MSYALELLTNTCVIINAVDLFKSLLFTNDKFIKTNLKRKNESKIVNSKRVSKTNGESSIEKTSVGYPTQENNKVKDIIQMKENDNTSIYTIQSILYQRHLDLEKLEKLQKLEKLEECENSETDYMNLKCIENTISYDYDSFSDSESSIDSEYDFCCLNNLNIFDNCGKNAVEIEKPILGETMDEIHLNLVKLLDTENTAKIAENTPESVKRDYQNEINCELKSNLSQNMIDFQFQPKKVHSFNFNFDDNSCSNTFDFKIRKWQLSLLNEK